jgi:phosphate uptake regulator
MEVRKLVRLRGSYLVYLPKRVASSFVSEEVVVFWEGDFVGVSPAALRRSTADVGLPQVVVAGYAVGLDELELAAAGEAVVEAAGKVGAVVEKADGVYRIRYVDKFMDKEEVVGRMLSALVYLLEGLAKGTAARATVQAADDETDVLRLTVNRLCTKTPTPKCTFYIQLARYYERAVDHVRELYAERPPQALWALLWEAAEELHKIHQNRQTAAIAQYLSTMASRRFAAMQQTHQEHQSIHAVRTLDYLENAAEVYLDMAIYATQNKSPLQDSIHTTSTPRRSRRKT